MRRAPWLRRASTLAKRTIDKMRWQLREFINPWLGKTAIKAIEAPDLLMVLRKIEARGRVETAHKSKELVGRVFLYGVATGKCKHNIAADLNGALEPRGSNHFAAITDPVKVGELLRSIFPAIGPKRRPISENTMGSALRALGYTSDVMVPHGFRSMASTLLHDRGFESRDIELQLAHSDSNKIRAIYNRPERIKERTKMMQRWSDTLDSLRADTGNVIALRPRA